MERRDLRAVDSDSENDGLHVIRCSNEELGAFICGLDELRTSVLSTGGHRPETKRTLAKVSRMLDQISTPVAVETCDKTAAEIHEELYPSDYVPGEWEKVDGADPFNLDSFVTMHIPGLDSTYDVSNRGDVFYNGNKRSMKEESNGRQFFITTSGGRRQKLYVDEVILRAFVGESKIPEAKPRYIDGDIRNCVLPNLCWANQDQVELF